jgi:iron complex outermembrane recepter protein
MNAHRIRPIALAIAAIGCPALFASHAFAADEVLSDVVVSAGRAEQRSFDAPAAVQAIGSQTIRDAGPQVNLSESINRVPGVIVLDRQNYSQDLQLSIRGFGARSTFGIRGIRLIVDGIPATMPDGQGQASTISLPSAERIEVLRGPLAQLYGNAAGGVVQVFTQNGPPEPFGQASFNAGSFGLQRYGLQTGGQSGIVNYFIDYSNFSIDGYRQNSTTSRQHLNSKFRFDVSDSTKVTVVANLFDQPKGKDPLGLTRAQAEADPRQAVAAATTQDAGKKVTQNQLGTVIEHAIDANNRVTGRAYFGSRDLYAKLSIPLATQAPATSAGGIVELDRAYQGIGLQYSNKTQTGAGMLTSVLGIDYDKMKDRRRGYINNAGAQGALKRDEDNLVENLDIYAQTNWLIDPKWSVTGGLRSSSVKFRVNDYFVAAGNPDDTGSAKYSAVNPVLGVTHFLNDQVNIYANLGRGFETPTFTELAYRSGGLTGLNFDLQASRARHLELGTKAKINQDHRLDAALFQINTDNELTVDTNTGGRSTYRNAGRTSRSGFELAYSGRFSESLTSHVALTALKAEFRDAYVGSGGAVAAGNNLPGVPNRFVYAEIAWRPKMDGGLKGLNVGAELVHSGKLYVNDSNTDSTASYTLMNLRAGLEQKVGEWRISEFARLNNISDKRYIGSVIVNDANGRFFEPAPGRNWMLGVTARYTFK